MPGRPGVPGWACPGSPCFTCWFSVPSVPSVPAIVPSTLASFGGVLLPSGPTTTPPGISWGVRGVPDGLRMTLPSGLLIDPSGWATPPTGMGVVVFGLPSGPMVVTTFVVPGVNPMICPKGPKIGVGGVLVAPGLKVVTVPS